jgi:hypothetical protein
VPEGTLLTSPALQTPDWEPAIKDKIVLGVPFLNMVYSVFDWDSKSIYCELPIPIESCVYHGTVQDRY